MCNENVMQSQINLPIPSSKVSWPPTVQDGPSSAFSQTWVNCYTFRGFTNTEWRYVDMDFIRNERERYECIHISMQYLKRSMEYISTQVTS